MSNANLHAPEKLRPRRQNTDGYYPSDFAFKLLGRNQCCHCDSRCFELQEKNTDFFALCVAFSQVHAYPSLNAPSQFLHFNIIAPFKPDRFSGSCSPTNRAKIGEVHDCSCELANGGTESASVDQPRATPWGIGNAKPRCTLKGCRKPTESPVPFQGTKKHALSQPRALPWAEILHPNWGELHATPQWLSARTVMHTNRG